MNQFGIIIKLVFFGSSLAFLMSSCNEPSTTEENPIESEQIQDPGVAQWKDHHFAIHTVIAGSTSVLSVKEKFGKEVFYGNTQVPTVYDIKQSVATDLNGDDLPEIVVLLVDFDMNSPMVKAFTNIGRGRLLEIAMPDLPQYVYDNYQGGDLLTPREQSIDYAINYISNGTPVRSTFSYIWNSEAAELELIEQR